MRITLIFIGAGDEVLRKELEVRRGTNVKDILPNFHAKALIQCDPNGKHMRRARYLLNGDIEEGKYYRIVSRGTEQTKKAMGKKMILT